MKGLGGPAELGMLLYKRMVKEGFIEKVTFEQRSERSEGVSPADIWRKRIPGRGTSLVAQWLRVCL